MKGDRKTKIELMKELESVRMKVKKLEALLEKRKHTQKDITEHKQAETTLKQVETYLRTVLNNAPITIFAIDNQGLFTLSEGKGLERVGLKPGENVGVSALDLFGTTSFKEYNGRVTTGKEIVQRVFAGETVNAIDELHGIYFDNHIGPIHDAEGKVAGIVGVATDITERKLAEEQLRQSEERFRLIAENAADLIAVLDIEGKRIYSSPSYKSIFGDPESLQGTDSFQEIHPDDREKIRRIFQETVRTGIGQRSEYRFLLGDGSVRYIESLGSVIRDENGNTNKVVVVSREVTERKRSEQELRESKALIEAVVENVPLMIFLKEATDLRFVIFNRAGEELLGYDRKDLLGRNDLSFFPPEQAAHFMAKDREVLDGETGMLDIPEEPIMTVKKGQRLLHTRKVCIKGADGVTKYLLGISEDITERKQAEKQITLLAHTLKSIAECVSITDLNDNVLFVNSAFLKTYGYSEQEILGKNINVVRSPNNPPEGTPGILAATLAGGWSGELMNRTKDGRDFPISLSTSFVRDDDGQVIALVGIASDITERKRKDETLRALSIRQEAILSAVPDIIMEVDNNKKYTWANQSGIEFFGDDVIGKEAAFYFEGEQDTYQTVQPLFNGSENVVNLESWQRRKDGEKRLLAWWRRFIKDENGNVIGALASAHDITEGRQAEKKNTEQARLLDIAIDAIIVRDIDDRLLFWNKGAENLYGWTSDEAKALDVRFLENEDERMNYEQHKREFFLKGYWEGELLQLTKERRPIVTYSRWTLVRNSEGKPISRLIITRDITEHKQAEDKLQESEERYKALFERSLDLVYVCDFEGNFIDANDAALNLLGYRKEEIGSLNFASLLSEDQLPLAFKTTQEIRETGIQMDLVEFKLQCRNGREVYVESKGSAIISNGITVAIQSIARNITERKRTEEELKNSEDKYRSIFENIQDVYYETSLDGTVLEVSPSVEVISKGQYRRADLIGRSMYEFYPDTKIRDTLIETMQKTSRITEFEVRLKNRDGSLIPCSISAKICFNTEGRPVKIIGSMHDISQRKRFEEALRETTDYLDNLLSFANAPILVWDNTNKITKFNLAFERLTGYTLYDVIGKQPEILFPDETREYLSSLISRASDGENMISIEMPVRCKDGSVRAVVWNTANIYSADGNTIIATIAHGQDITKRKQAEESLQESELRFRSLYENATIGLYRTTPDGKILLANPALIKMLGYTSFQQLADRNLEKDGFETSAQRKEFLEKIEKDGEVHAYDSKWICQDNRTIFILESARAIRDSEGKTMYYDGTVEDITERKLLEDQMRQMQKLESLGTLAGGIAHDFNNILGIILAYVTTIDRLKNDPEKLQRAVDTISTAVQRGAALVRQILTFARKSDVEFELTDINTVAKEVIDMILETFPRTLTYSQNLQKDIPPINADRSQIHQALLNLSVNARDAMPNGGVLTINTRLVSSMSLRNQHPDALASTYVCIEVGDTGIGMSKKVRDRIFEPFFTTKEKGKGTGLGLAVVFGVIKTHKGFVEVESDPGNGTTFRLYFPVPSATMPAQEKIQEIAKEIPGGTETLLVVEDEETLMTFLQLSLTAKGYTVIAAGDGPEAVKIYRERNQEISMVFTDLGLPGMTGVEEINLIKKINQEAKIIVATGYLDPEMKSELLKSGVKKFVLKPYNFEEFMILVRGVLDEK